MDQYVRSIDELKLRQHKPNLHVFGFDKKIIDEIENNHTYAHFDEIVFYPNKLSNNEYVFLHLQRQCFVGQCVIVFVDVEDIHKGCHATNPTILNPEFNKLKRIELTCTRLTYSLLNYHKCFDEIHLDLTSSGFISDDQMITLMYLKKESKLSVKLRLSKLTLYSDDFLDRLKCSIVIDDKNLSMIKNKNLNVYKYCVYSSVIHELNYQILPEKFDISIGLTIPEGFEQFVLENAHRIDEIIFESCHRLIAFSHLDEIQKKNTNMKFTILSVCIDSIEYVREMLTAIGKINPSNLRYNYINMEIGANLRSDHHRDTLNTLISHLENAHIDHCRLAFFGYVEPNINLKYSKVTTSRLF